MHLLSVQEESLQMKVEESIDEFGMERAGEGDGSERG